ncbi:thermonuclease family protein [Psychrobacillus sp. FSL K6-1267]|uniref:thermonuclease family protein n=1 Tax=Psychrobacillus sp. FSL K6-1267 TaxID=2921543 RepID=UPI0030F7AEB0
MRKRTIILLIFFLFIPALSAALAAPLSLLGWLIAVFGYYQLRQQRKGKLTFSRPKFFIIGGIILGFFITVLTVPDAPPSEKTIVEIKKEVSVNKKEADPKQEISQPVSQPIPPTSNNGAETTSSEKATVTTGTTDLIPVTLVSITDGDTIKVIYNGKEENVRYLLIDTPETSHPQLGKQPFGEEAKLRNDELINNGELSLEFDVGERVDKYGRLLAYVYVDGKSVQETLIEEGLARVAYVYPPNTRHLTPYEEAQKSAKTKGLGIWSVENYATDSGFNSEVASITEPVTATPVENSTATNTTETEWFQNCTELRTKYPSGVASDHPAYQSKMDRDKDNWACEK